MPQELNLTLTDDVDPDEHDPEAFEAVCDHWRSIFDDPDENDAMEIMFRIRDEVRKHDIPIDARADLVCDSMLVAFEEEAESLRSDVYDCLPHDWK